MSKNMKPDNIAGEKKPQNFQAMSVLQLNTSEERLTAWPFPHMIALWVICSRELCMLAEGTSKAKGSKLRQNVAKQGSGHSHNPKQKQLHALLQCDFWLLGLHDLDSPQLLGSEEQAGVPTAQFQPLSFLCALCWNCCPSIKLTAGGTLFHVY